MIEQHEATGSASLVDDKDLVATLGVPLADVQRQLVILGQQQVIDLLQMFDPEYSARLTASGMEVLEISRQEPPPQHKIGF